MVKNPKAKIHDKLDIRTFPTKHSKPKKRYLVFRLPDGSYHTFVEVQAKAAALECGAEGGRESNTRTLWDELWYKQVRPKPR
ncbi:MAG TPA: hypothetical protein VFE98_04415 [Candidatus Bathyarchaeia archaeon]|nr:hypothetical protein [Candidatus Bathyarchaeia archaeon]